MTSLPAAGRVVRDQYRDRVSVEHVGSLTDATLRAIAREAVLRTTGRPSPPYFDATVTRYPGSDSAVVSLWKD